MSGLQPEFRCNVVRSLQFKIFRQEEILTSDELIRSDFFRNLFLGTALLKTVFCAAASV